MLKRFLSTKQSAIPSTFKTFAEYRQFIIKKDPQTLKLRHDILFKGNQKAHPEAERELNEFKEKAKGVAYNN